MARKCICLLLSSALLSSAVVIPPQYSSSSYRDAVPRDFSRITPRAVNSTNYDFVIIGAGIAGLVLGSRLSEDSNVKVLNIEAGPFDKRGDGILVPGDWDPFPYVWPGLMTQPLTALNDRVYPPVCARLVGGGSAINAMNWIRGTKGDYDGWEALGNDGWGWDGLLPYLMKTENFTAPDASFAAEANISWTDSYRGEGGPIQISYANEFYPGSANWWNAGLSIGMKEVADPNSGVNSGLFWPPTVFNVANQTRCDARAGYYDPVSATRPNWHILTDHMAAKVLFEGKRATGVQYVPSAGGQKLTVRASKEVIVAAGALHTPQILQLSGVGPKVLLDSFNIPVISDVPGVGSNLQDQTSLFLLYNFTDLKAPNAMSLTTDAAYNTREQKDYNEHLSSAFTIVKNLSTTFGAMALDFVPEQQKIISNIQAYNAADSLPADVDPTVLAGYKAQRKALIRQFQSSDISSGILVWDTSSNGQVISLKPLSRGTLYINSTDPLADPLIDFRTCTDPADFAILTAYFHKQRELFASASMAALGPSEFSPGDKIQSDQEILEFIKQTLVPSNAHECCSAPMMPKELGGACDTERKVYGVDGLRIGDVSAIPIAVAAGPTPSTYGAAEKLADMIKKQYNLAQYARKL